ncbi:MAG: glycerol kinase GlpK [Planctomycetota bacterium]|nr:glycerol kinase GlpK [Planctomycetota bacterium]
MRAMQHILAIDQGTTGTTVLVLDEALSVRGRGYQEFAQHYPAPGHVEHDPQEILTSVRAAITAAIAQSGVAPTELAAVGITNQRETVVVWDRATGEPVHRAIVWQDRRTADACRRLIDDGHEDAVRQATGLPIDPYFSATKLAWILDQGDLRARAERGELAFGTVDAFLVHALTGGDAHATDVSNASRTLLFDLQAMSWSDDLLARFRVPRSVLPEVAPSAGVFGTVRGIDGLPDGLPITGIAGDQQAALFGQACFSPGDAKCTYGTGAFLLMNTGAMPVASASGLVTTVAWEIPGERAYALEGSAFVAGAAVQWLRDGLGFFSSSAEVEALAASVESSDGVVVVPAFTGLGSPHWRPDARGAITGLTRGTTRAHIARATLEGVALQNVDILRAMEKDAGQPLGTLKVDGGAAANDLLMQFQSDVLGVPIRRPQLLETTALGAAFLAGLGCGLWPDKAAITATWREDRAFTPQLADDEVAAHLARWADAVEKA